MYREHISHITQTGSHNRDFISHAELIEQHNAECISHREGMERRLHITQRRHGTQGAYHTEKAWNAGCISHREAHIAER